MKRRLLSDVLLVSGGYSFNHTLYMVRGLLLARLLGPAGFGVWSAMRLSQSLAMMAHLGSRNGMVQLVPRATGASDAAAAGRIERTTAGLHVLAAAASAIGVMGLGVLSASNRLDWIAFGAVLFVAQIFFFVHALARSRQRFALSSGAEVLIAAASTVVGLLAASRFGLFGFVVVLALSYLGGALLVGLGGVEFPRPILHLGAARDLLRVGFPLMASGGLFTLLWNVDKLLLWLLGSSEALGVYAVQSSFTTVALLAPAALSTVLHPHLMHRLGATGTGDSIRPYLMRGTELLAACSAPVAALGSVVLHLPVRWLLPEYEQAIDPGRVLMVAAYFSMIATVPTVVISVLDGQKKLCLIRSVAIAIAAAGGMLAFPRGYVGLALAMSAALAVDGLWTLSEASLRAEMRTEARWALFARVALPFALVLAPVALSWGLFPDRADTFPGDLMTTLGRASVAVVPSLVWAAWLVRGLGLPESEQVAAPSIRDPGRR